VMIKPKTIFVMAFCAFMFAALCYLLAFGGAVFCCAPARPGKGFWQPEKFFYGLLPMFASIVAFAFTFQLWARAFIRQRNAWLVWGVVAIFAVVLDFSLFLKYRGRQDERIKLVWKGESGAFSWGSGEVKLPAGFTYKANHGIDTFVGQFTSQDGNLVIEHDIGELAGEHGGMGKSETLTEGSRVRVGRAIRHDDNGRTTFFSKVSSRIAVARTSTWNPTMKMTQPLLNSSLGASVRQVGHHPGRVHFCLKSLGRTVVIDSAYPVDSKRIQTSELVDYINPIRRTVCDSN
jgi:hypothetical protein